MVVSTLQLADCCAAIGQYESQMSDKRVGEMTSGGPQVVLWMELGAKRLACGGETINVKIEAKRFVGKWFGGETCRDRADRHCRR